MCHQHSPCANDSPIPYEEKFFISGIVTTPMSICQSPSRQAPRRVSARWRFSLLADIGVQG
jgi:hypothetical protein